jgi:hypothetical protein
MWMHKRRFTRLTNGFSKKAENHAHAVAIHFMWYNFAKIHTSLRSAPAMAAGVTDRVWDAEDIVAPLDEAMSMMDGHFTRARIRWKLRRLDRWLAKQTVLATTPERENEIFERWKSEYVRLDRARLQSQTQLLRRQSDWWGLDFPSPSEQPDSWEWPKPGLPYLNDKAITKARRRIGEERWRQGQRWSSVLIPLLSLIVAIMALARSCQAP